MISEQNITLQNNIAINLSETIHAPPTIKKAQKKLHQKMNVRCTHVDMQRHKK